MHNAFEMSTMVFSVLYILVRRDTFIDVVTNNNNNNKDFATAGAHIGALALFVR